MSKLIDKLDRAARGTVVPLGFGSLARKEKVAPILLLGCAKTAQKDQIQRIVDAGLDGALLEQSSQTTSKQITAAGKLLGDLPWGLWQENATPPRANGSDFLVIASDTTPIDALEGEDTTNAMVVTLDIDDSLLSAIEELPIDIVFVPIDNPQKLTVGQLLQIGRIRRFISKHLMLHATKLPSIPELKQLKDVGIQGVIVETGKYTVDELKTCHTQLLEIDPPQPRARERTGASLPTLPSNDAPNERIDEDEEEYDD